VEDERILGVNLFQEILDDLLFARSGRCVDPAVAFLELVALVKQERDIAAIVDDELRAGAIAVTEPSAPTGISIAPRCSPACPGSNRGRSSIRTRSSAASG
jgi:hypothetical protein